MKTDGPRAGSTRWRVRAARGILLKAPEAREPRTGRQPTTTEADVRPLRAEFLFPQFGGGFVELCTLFGRRDIL